jgi:hypothetical protein
MLPHRSAQVRQGLRMIDRERQLQALVRLQQPYRAGDIRPDQVIGQEDIPHAGPRQHLGLGQRRAFVLDDAARHFQLDDLGDLVRLAMRPQPRWIAGDAEHRLQVLHDQFAEHDQGGSENPAAVFEIVTRNVHKQGSRFTAIRAIAP